MATVTIKDNMLVEHSIEVTDELREAASRYRVAHAALEASSEQEPEHDEEGEPIDSGAWLTWYEGSHRALSIERQTAAKTFTGLLGFSTLHPFTLDPAAAIILD